MRGAADYAFSWRDGIAYKRVASHQASLKMLEIIRDNHVILR
jgi:hypothetical protein